MITKQDTRVKNSQGKTGVIVSGIPFRVANRVYVSVRWDGEKMCSNVKAASLQKA